MVIPPGSAHWFNKINGHITYIQARFPGNVTPSVLPPATALCLFCLRGSLKFIRPLPLRRRGT